MTETVHGPERSVSEIDQEKRNMFQDPGTGGTCWDISPERGFLANPDPLPSLNRAAELEQYLTRDDAAVVEQVAAELRALIDSRSFRKRIKGLPVLKFDSLELSDCNDNVLERLILLYSYYANAYVFEDPDAPADHLPVQIARPLHFLTKLVDRHPILSYPSYILYNWRRLDPDGPLTVENLALLQEMQGGADESWFVLIHVEIEAIAAAILRGIRQGVEAKRHGDDENLVSALGRITDGIRGMTRTLRRMPEGCDPHTYYHRVRPYIDGFDNVVLEGVAEYAMKPQSFRGQAAAQSSIVPSVVEFLGIMHETSGLTQHLKVMREYMPVSHRRFIDWAGQNDIRAYVSSADGGEAARSAYNSCVESLAGFRMLHLKTVKTYIFDQSGDPEQLGTGGTKYLQWLRQLAEETQRHLVR